MARPKKNPEAATAAAEPVRKAAVAKSEKPPVQKVEEIYLQFGGEEWNISECKERVIAAYVAEGHRKGRINNLTIYLKPEERKVYYVVNNGKATGSVDL